MISRSQIKFVRLGAVAFAVTALAILPGVSTARAASPTPTAPPASTPAAASPAPSPSASSRRHRDGGENGASSLGKMFNATLTTLDGTVLKFPRDFLGKVTVLHFWTMDDPIDLTIMRLNYEQYRDRGVQVIGINVDPDKAQVETYIRQQGVTWPQVCSGAGADDPLFKQLEIPTKPFFWVIGADGRVVQGNEVAKVQWRSGLEHMKLAVQSQLDDGRDLAERMSYYRSGEFLAFTSLLPGSAAGDSSAQADLEALRQKLLTPRWSGVSPDRKSQLFKELLAEAQGLEGRHLSDGQLALVRSWMLIAAKWLAVTTGDKAFEEQATAIANRLLAAKPSGVPGFFADYAVTSAKLMALEPGTDEGAKLIRDYLERNASGDAVWSAQMLAVVMAMEDAQDSLRKQLVTQLVATCAAQPNPVLAGFLRSVCGEKVDRDIALRAQLTGMDGHPLSLPDDLSGKVIILQFWSTAHPPEALPINLENPALLPYTGLATVPSKGVVVVGINLDSERDHSAIETFLKKNHYSDWIHTWSSHGWDNPIVRECDIIDLPQTIVLNRDGKLVISERTKLPERINQAVAPSR